MAQIQPGGFYSVEQAARRLGVSHSTVWRWIAAGKLVAYRVGPRSIRIREEDLAGVVQPARSDREEVNRTKQHVPMQTTVKIRPLTEEERQHGLEALDQIDALQQRMLAARSGTPFPSSVDLIRQMREDRSRQLDER
jgi:excisionase family DNA binding protein